MEASLKSWKMPWSNEIGAAQLLAVLDLVLRLA
jgi:hypothetical protein